VCLLFYRTIKNGLTIVPFPVNALAKYFSVGVLLNFDEAFGHI
jgi:hypothetical protein